MHPTKDWCSRAGAYELADKIKLYWALRGKAVKIEIFTNGDDDRKAIWAIRSDLVMRAPERAP